MRADIMHRTMQHCSILPILFLRQTTISCRACSVQSRHLPFVEHSTAEHAAMRMQQRARS